ELRISLDPAPPKIGAQHVIRDQHRERDHQPVRGNRKPAEMQKRNHGQPVYSSASAVNSGIPAAEFRWASFRRRIADSAFRWASSKKSTQQENQKSHRAPKPPTLAAIAQLNRALRIARQWPSRRFQLPRQAPAPRRPRAFLPGKQTARRETR